MRTAIFALMSSLMILLGGCALPSVPARSPPADLAIDDLAAPRAGYARLFLLRPSRSFAADVWPDVSLNDEVAVGLRNGRYSYVYLSPGRYRVDAAKAQWYSPRWNASEELFVEPEQSYFLLFEQPPSGDGWRWRRIDAARAAGALRGLRYVEATAATF